MKLGTKAVVASVSVAAAAAQNARCASAVKADSTMVEHIIVQSEYEGTQETDTGQSRGPSKTEFISCGAKVPRVAIR